MTLRESLGPSASHVHEQVDALLDREDSLVVLFDGDRMVSYTHGFGVSADQLELLSVELERAVRDVVGRQPGTSTKGPRNREESNESDGRGRSAVRRQDPSRDGRGDHDSLGDGRSQRVRRGDAPDGNSGGAGRVLRLPSRTR